MGLEELVELKTRFDSQEALQFGLGEPVVLILLGRPRFERQTGQIAASA